MEIHGDDEKRLDPERGKWAPLLWKILHTLIEKSGRGSKEAPGGWFGTYKGSLSADEARELFWLLIHIEYIIPCTRCRKHLIEYKQENPLHKTGGFKIVRHVVQEFDKEIVRRWLWEFHNAVNMRLGKMAGPGLEELEGIYGGMNIKEMWREFWIDIFPELGAKGGLDHEKMREYNRHFTMWKGFTGI